MRRILVTRSAVAITALLVLGAATGGCRGEPGDSEHLTSSSPQSLVREPIKPVRSFVVRGLGNRCWDFTDPTTKGAVTLASVPHLAACDGSPGQQVVVSEQDATHDVVLKVGAYCLGVAGSVAVGALLEVQACLGVGPKGTSVPTTSPLQRFALDGDSVLMGSQRDGERVLRDRVIEPVGYRTEHGTRLVVGTREVDDAEYFRVLASDGSNVPPHSGFVRLPNPSADPATDDAALDAALKRGWGTVVELDDSRPISITQFGHVMAAGTTLRGYRKLTYQGPELTFSRLDTDGSVFELDEDHVRITGLRFRGPSRGQSDSLKQVVGISVHRFAADPLTDVLIDHVDGSDFTEAFLAAKANDTETQPFAWVCQIPPLPAPPVICRGEIPVQTCPTPVLPYPRQAVLHAIGNFIHHNVRDGLGYGVAVGDGAFAEIQANLMYLNRHSLTADGRGQTGYSAYDNFVLSDAPGYGPLTIHQQDFDKHGTLYPGHWIDGISDDFVDIGWNTFLGTNREPANIDERGTPCRFTAIHDNAFRATSGGAFHTRGTDPGKDVLYANQYGVVDPTNDLAVGDFDGDQVDDVFVGTGTGWWFSSGGAAEWRLLSRKSERASQVRFGDFDGDGRSDVVTIHNGLVDISWAGVSSWQSINAAAWNVTDLAVGDFDGDHVADLFLATGTQWFMAPRGKTWQLYATLAFRASQLRFGDFDADGKTDVFGVVGNQWMTVPAGTAAWVPLRTALTTNVSALVVADFDGDGYADVARKSGSAWQYSARGWGGFATLRNTDDALLGSPIGRFDGDAKADVLVMKDRHLQLSSGARLPLTPWGRQDAQ